MPVVPLVCLSLTNQNGNLLSDDPTSANSRSPNQIISKELAEWARERPLEWSHRSSGAP